MRVWLQVGLMLAAGGAVLAVLNHPAVIDASLPEERHFYDRIADARALDQHCELLAEQDRRRLNARMHRMAEALTPSLRDRTDPLAAADRLAEIEEAAATRAARANCTAADTADMAAAVTAEVVGADFAEVEAQMLEARQLADRCGLLGPAQRDLLARALAQVQGVITTNLDTAQSRHYEAYRAKLGALSTDCATATQRLERALDQARSGGGAAT